MNTVPSPDNQSHALSKDQTRSYIQADLYTSRMVQTALYATSLTGGVISSHVESGHVTPYLQIFAGTVAAGSFIAGMFQEHFIESARTDVKEHAAQENYPLDEKEVAGATSKLKAGYKSFSALTLGAFGAHMLYDGIDFEQVTNSLSSPSFALGALAAGASVVLFQNNIRSTRKLEEQLSEQLDIIEPDTIPPSGENL